jgi:hypothetical protein
MNKIEKDNLVSVTAKANDMFEDFIGTVIGVNGSQVIVRDQDDDVWDCEAEQCEVLTDEFQTK